MRYVLEMYFRVVGDAYILSMRDRVNGDRFKAAKVKSWVAGWWYSWRSVSECPVRDSRRWKW